MSVEHVPEPSVHMESPAMLGKSAEEIRQILKKRKTTEMHSEFAHACVSTSQIHAGPASNAATGDGWSTEAALWPPRLVESTDHKSVGKCVIGNMVEHLFDMGLLGMLVFLTSLFAGAVFVFCCDQASANYVMLRKFASRVVDLTA